ncbi:hypothetical protein [Leekyejoonella antrihumi]|uniref:DUF3040 domain-containing protein n=1 Tax=Leekyejoonella antrihumi TaxID=1660198 RepID=A0A563E813_9MICO|nr:hypothetical protein [Leekyejoonella antrihumi]TWP38585.1 hypothetical protein FGL98_02005 [Leekyejoonella antrihumi]
MALTSEERKSFEHIVTQLSTSDRWFTWRTAPSTRRGMWVRRQIWRVISAPLMVWGAMTAAGAWLLASTVSTACAITRLGRYWWSILSRTPQRLALLLRAFWQRARHRTKARSSGRRAG